MVIQWRRSSFFPACRCREIVLRAITLGPLYSENRLNFVGHACSVTDQSRHVKNVTYNQQFPLWGKSQVVAAISQSRRVLYVGKQPRFPNRGYKTGIAAYNSHFPHLLKRVRFISVGGGRGFHTARHGKRGYIHWMLRLPLHPPLHPQHEESEPGGGVLLVGK